jgi:rhodanese-related sulfurtransferase
MALARDAAGGIERLITRSLAIVAIAVAAGAAHSWLYGPLNPTQEVTQPVPGPEGAPNTDPEAGNPTETDPTETDPTETDTPPPGNGDEQGNGDEPGEAGDATPDPVLPDPPVAVTLPEGHITVAEAYDHFLNGTADFIDARPADEYAEGHIPGALNLSLEMTQNSTRVQDVLQWLDTSRPIVVYCRGGLCSEAKDVGRLLSDANYSQVLIFADGFPGWQEANYMIETGPGQ